MNDVNAVIGLEQLKYVGQNIQKHRDNAARFNQAFEGLNAVKPLQYKSDRLSSYWLYTLRVNNKDAFIEYTKRANITVSQVHARNDRHSIFKDSLTSLPGVDEFVAEQIAIPVGWWLSDNDVEYIIETVIKYDRKN